MVIFILQSLCYYFLANYVYKVVAKSNEIEFNLYTVKMAGAKSSLIHLQYILSSSFKVSLLAIYVALKILGCYRIIHSLQQLFYFSERAIPKRKPMTYNPQESDIEETVLQHQHQPQHNQPALREHVQNKQQMLPSHVDHYNHRRTPEKRTPYPQQDHRPSQHAHRQPQNQREHERKPQQYLKPGSYQHSHQSRSRALVASDYDRMSLRVDDVDTPIASEKVKSNSLDDLRLLREGLVANTKAVFSPTKEPGKQVNSSMQFFPFKTTKNMDSKYFHY